MKARGKGRKRTLYISYYRDCVICMHSRVGVLSVVPCGTSCFLGSIYIILLSRAAQYKPQFKLSILTTHKQPRQHGTALTLTDQTPDLTLEHKHIKAQYNRAIGRVCPMTNKRH